MAKQISSGENIMGTEKISKLVITTGIPLAFLLSRTGQLQVVWTAFILAELLGIPVAWFLWRKSFNESVSTEPEFSNV